MGKKGWAFRVFLVGVGMLLYGALCSQATVIYHCGGIYNSWPTTWSPITSLNDPDDGLSYDHLDFVGDSYNPGVYYSSDANYLYFRVRVDAGTPASNTFSDSVIILVDNVNAGTTNIPDYGFGWDSKSGDNANHGLELMTNTVQGATWGAMRMGDVDGNSGQKYAPPDFGYANGDGYIQTTDGQATTNFGTTTYIDFAISWNYLQANTTLGPGQTWRLQVASIDNANDHNLLRYDVAGNTSPSTAGLLWSSSFVIPEPSTFSLLALGLFSALFRRRRP